LYIYVRISEVSIPGNLFPVVVRGHFVCPAFVPGIVSSTIQELRKGGDNSHVAPHGPSHVGGASQDQDNAIPIWLKKHG
jgi:hypothetical protein